MCTVIVVQEPGVPFPVIVAANRDERADRPAKPFGRHGEAAWRGGLDVLAGGTWFGLHDSGFAIYMLNGAGALGPVSGLRSRGLLAVELLESGSAEAAANRVLETPPGTVRPCHVLIAGPAGVTAISHPGSATGAEGWIRRPVEVPISMWTAHGENVPTSPRVAAHLEAAGELGAHWSERGDIREFLGALEAFMARPAPEGAPRQAALGIPVGDDGFGTLSTSILAFPRAGAGRPILGRIADGPPGGSRFRRLSLQVD